MFSSDSGMLFSALFASLFGGRVGAIIPFVVEN